MFIRLSGLIVGEKLSNDYDKVTYQLKIFLKISLYYSAVLNKLIHYGY